ncbi:MAG: HD-GYP domain-containing protein [Treponema sp.]
MDTTVTLESLKPELKFKSDLMLDERFILLPATTAVTEELIKVLTEWDFKEFISDEQIGADESPLSAPSPAKALKTKIDVSSEQKVKDAAKEVIASTSTLKFANTERSRMDSVQKVYNEYIKYIDSIYTHYSTHKKIDLNDLSANVKNLCIFIKDNKRYVLRITPSIQARNKNFLVMHSMRSTVVAITIGMQLHLSLSKLIELGITCILHEIGMLRLPPQLYMTDKSLSPSERAQIMTHTVLGFNILKELNFPLSIQLGVLEHHEKENGQGYPRQLLGNKISTYAKIIVVACSFEAISAPREYKTERTTFDAMVEMLKNQNNQYDATVIKALLYSLSLFPIGAYVYLNNGKIGVVTDVAANNPTKPIVQLVNEYEANGSPKSIQTDDDANKIVRVLSRQEEDDVRNAMKAKAPKCDVNYKKTPQGAAVQEKPRAEVKVESVKAAQPDSKGFSEVDVNDFS